MAPRTFTIIERSGKRTTVEADTEDTVLQLAGRVSLATGYNKDTFTLLPKGSSIQLSEHKSTTELKDLHALDNADIIYLIRRENPWRYGYNATPITNKNTRKYHTRILKEKLEKLLEAKRQRDASTALPSGGSIGKRGLQTWTAKAKQRRGGKRKNQTRRRR